MRHVLAAFAVLTLCACGQKETTTVADTSSTNAPPASSTTVSGPAGTPGQPCSYVTEAEVTEVMGHPMKFSTSGNPNECNLVSSSGDTTKSASFQITDGSSFYDAMASAAGSEPVSGLGDKAVVVPTTNIVAAAKGARSYMGGVYLGPSSPEAKAKSIDLARKIVPRI